MLEKLFLFFVRNPHGYSSHVIHDVRQYVLNFHQCHLELFYKFIVLVATSTPLRLLLPPPPKHNPPPNPPPCPPFEPAATRASTQAPPLAVGKTRPRRLGAR